HGEAIRCSRSGQIYPVGAWSRRERISLRLKLPAGVGGGPRNIDAIFASCRGQQGRLIAQGLRIGGAEGDIPRLLRDRSGGWQERELLVIRTGRVASNSRRACDWNKEISARTKEQSLCKNARLVRRIQVDRLSHSLAAGVEDQNGIAIDDGVGLGVGELCVEARDVKVSIRSEGQSFRVVQTGAIKIARRAGNERAVEVKVMRGRVILKSEDIPAFFALGQVAVA